MKKVILAIGMILPMMSLQAKVFDVKMENTEAVKVSGLGNVSVVMNEIDNGTEISVKVTLTQTGVIQSEKVTGEKTSLVVKSFGDKIVIECLPNEVFRIVTTNGIVVASGKLDASGKAEIENTFETNNMYIVSVGNNKSEKIKK